MAERLVWATSEDGTLEYVQLTKEYVEQAVDLLCTSFYGDEPLSRAIGLGEYPEASQDIKPLTQSAIAQGISLGCVEKATGILVGVTINVFQSRRDKEDDYTRFEPRTAIIKELSELLSHVCGSFNLLEHCNVENSVDLRQTGVLSTFRKRGIGRKLHDLTLELAKKLNRGEDVRVPITDSELGPLEKPEILTDVCTSPFTIKMIINMGMEIPERKYYKDVVMPNGFPLGSKIPDETAHVAFGYLRL